MFLVDVWFFLLFFPPLMSTKVTWTAVKSIHHFVSFWIMPRHFWNFHQLLQNGQITILNAPQLPHTPQQCLIAMLHRLSQDRVGNLWGCRQECWKTPDITWPQSPYTRNHVKSFSNRRTPYDHVNSSSHHNLFIAHIRLKHGRIYNSIETAEKNNWPVKRLN